jgi:hypothetical protein
MSFTPLNLNKPTDGFEPLFGPVATPPEKKQGIFSKAGNAVYDIAGSLLVPTATPQELRNPTLLKDTVLGLPKAALDTANQIVSHPLDSTYAMIGGASRGVADTVTGILTNLFVPKADQEGTSAEVKKILDKYMGVQPDNTLSQGFQLAGGAAPYILAGGVAGEVGGTLGARIGGGIGQKTGTIANRVANLSGAKTGAKIGAIAGSASGFVGVGQAAIPTDSTLQQRAEQAAKDLVALGLFSLGSKAFDVATSRIKDGLKAKAVLDSKPPEGPSGPNAGPPPTPSFEPLFKAPVAPESARTAPITPKVDWYRGEGANGVGIVGKELGLPAGDKFYTNSKTEAKDYAGAGGKVITPSEMPKNPLVIADKRALADEMGYKGNPTAKPVAGETSFDNLAKQYAQSKGHDAIIYNKLSTKDGYYKDAPQPQEMHVFKTAPKTTWDSIYKRDSGGGFGSRNGEPMGNMGTFDVPESINNAQVEWNNKGTETARKNLLARYSTKQGKVVLQDIIDNLPKNPDGTITAYRTGKIGGNAQSYTLSEGMAKTFSHQGTDIPKLGYGLPSEYKNLGGLETNLVKIDPAGIRAFSHYDAEVLVDSSFVKTKSQLTDLWNKAHESAPPKTTEELVARANKYSKEFQSKVDTVAKSLGLTVEHGPVKTSERINERIATEGETLATTRDANRSTLLVKDPAELQPVIDSVTKEFGNTSRVKDKFNLPSGEYKSAIINVKSPLGHEVEIAVTTPEMWNARMVGGGDALFKLVRVKAPNWEKFDAQMKRLYAAAEESANARLSATSLLKASSETVVPSARALKGEKGAPPAVTPKTSSVDGSKSTLTKTSETSKNLGSPSISKSVPQQTPESKVGTTASPKPVDTVGDTFTSRVFERMQAEHPEIVGEATVTRTNLLEDAKKAVELVATDKQKAFEVAMGQKTLPDVTSTAVNIAMTEKALLDGNYDLAGKLIKSRSLEQTRRGQEIVAERGSVTDNSTSKYVKELVAARLDALGKKYLGDLPDIPGRKRVADKTKAIDKIDSEVTKLDSKLREGTLDVKSALDLIDLITCL